MSSVSIRTSLEQSSILPRSSRSRFDHVCEGSWLAECSLAHPEGAFIRQVISSSKRARARDTKRFVVA